MSRNDGEWWLRGLPLVSERKQEPPRERWIDRVQNVIAIVLAALTTGHGWVAFGMSFLIITFIASGARLLLSGRLDRAALARIAALTPGPVVYMTGTLSFGSTDSTRRDLQVAGLICFVAACIFITVIDRSRRGERTG